MLIDTHAHLTYPDFNNDRDAMLARAAHAGVGGFLTVATVQEEWQRCLDLAEGKPAVRVALGVHPNETSTFTPEVAAQMKALAAKDPRVVGIGETGLDFFREHSPREKQREAFQAHLDIAAELKKTFILHCRAAETEMIEMLAGFRKTAGAGLGGIWHCFTSTPEFAARAMDLDLYFGLGGVVTYPKADNVRKAVATLPADRILLETDCPFLPPQGWRGQRNEPAYLAKVVEVIAEVRKTTPEEISRITTENAIRVLGTFA
ncbi:MAG TPA: TatD family hydrolase [Planctomycetota bacterium]|jgi:TatD DNase family protein